MRKKIDLPEALKKRMAGKKVTVVLDADIATLTLGVLMGLDDIGADFLIDVPAVEDNTFEQLQEPSREEKLPVPAITVEQMEGDPLESPPSEEASAKKSRSAIDVGKVKALRKAGWTLKAIAEEMYCSPQNISMILNKEKTNGEKEK